MSIEENLKSIADSLKELTEIGRLNLALAAARNAEKTLPSTSPSGPSEPARTEPSASPPVTADSTPAAARKPGRPKKAAPAPEPVTEPAAAAPEVVPEPVVEPAKEPVVVEERPPAPVVDELDDFLDAPKAEVTYPDPTPENVRKALIEFAARNGGSEPNQGGRAAARALMKRVTGCEVMPQLETLVKQKGSTEPYALVIKAAMEG
jgi:hypothetical protein